MTDDTLYVAKVVKSTAVDGVGLRNSLYVSGCSLRCPGCHNEAFWELSSGRRLTLEEVYAQLCDDDFGISILGGEPMMQHEAVTRLCRMIKERTGKNIGLWSGFTLEHISTNWPDVLRYIDVLVDGPYIEAEREPGLQWRGSRNQRVIDLRHSR